MDADHGVILLLQQQLPEFFGTQGENIIDRRIRTGPTLFHGPIAGVKEPGGIAVNTGMPGADKFRKPGGKPGQHIPNFAAGTLSLQDFHNGLGRRIMALAGIAGQKQYPHFLQHLSESVFSYYNR